MKRLILIALTFLATPAFSGVVENCEKDWPGDYTMQVACQDAELEALEAIDAFEWKYKVDTATLTQRMGKDGNFTGHTLTVAELIWARCVIDWGESFVMTWACIQEQEISAKKLGKL